MKVEIDDSKRKIYTLPKVVFSFILAGSRKMAGTKRPVTAAGPTVRYL